MVRHHDLGPGDRGHTPLPLFHVNAQVVGLLATLLSGGSLAVEARFDRDGYWERVAAAAPTWLNAVPAVLAELAELPAPPEALTDELARACAERLARHKRPVEIRVAASLPVGPTGKVRRRQLRAGLAA